MTAEVWGTGVIVAILRQVGAAACFIDWLKMVVNAEASLLADVTVPVTPSGTRAFLVSMLRMTCFTSYGCRASGWSLSEVVLGVYGYVYMVDSYFGAHLNKISPSEFSVLQIILIISQVVHWTSFDFETVFV